MKEVESVGGENGCGARRNIEQNYPQNAPKTEVRILHLPRPQRINAKHGGNANSRAMIALFPERSDFPIKRQKLKTEKRQGQSALHYWSMTM